MAADVYGFGEDDARKLKQIADGVYGRGVRKKSGNGSDFGTIKIARMSAEVAAATDGQLVSGTADLAIFDPSSSPATITTSGMSEITVWNPHDEAIPINTYVILGRTVNGWVIIQPLNYCP